MKTFSRILALPLLALPLAACGDSHAPAAVAALQPVAVRIASAGRLAAADHTEISGTVAAGRSTDVSSRVMAMITAVHVELGDSVAAGQTLLSIDPTTAEGQLAQAEGGLAQARAALVLATRNHERFQALAATESASELELDMARMQFEQAAGAVKQAEGAVSAARSVARESSVRAPFAGRVAARFAEVGDLAAPGRPLVRIESQAGRRLVVEVPESLAAAASLVSGAAIAVTLDARPDLGQLAGTVIEVSPGPDPVTHAFTVKIDLPSGADSPSIAAGSAGRAFLPLGQRDSVVVPREAIVRSGGLDLVVVRDEQGLAQSRVVTLGAATADGRVEVLSGLAGDESLALGLAVAPPLGTPLEVTP